MACTALACLVAVFAGAADARTLPVFAAAGAPSEAPSTTGLVQTIENDGIATVDVTPDYAEFWLHFVARSQLLADAAAAAQGFEAAVRKKMEERQLAPAMLRFSGVSIPDARTTEAHASAVMRFSAGQFSDAKNGPRSFGDSCDGLRTMAEELDCRLEGPILGVEASQSVEKEAVRRAIEQAYPAAESAASVMKAQIVAVTSVRVLWVEWNTVPAVRSIQPDLRRATCTARVRVTYVFEGVTP